MAISLKYWNGRGLMEVPRMLLAVSGRFPPADYADNRFSSPPAGLDANLGRMPVATIGDVSIGQSAAINHYFASQYGLMGKDNIEAAQIVSVSEHLKEMIASFRTLVAWNKVPDPAALDKWFEGGAVDLTGTADRPGQGTRYMKWWMGRMETVMGPNGFAVGSKLSLADILLYYTLKDSLSPEQAAPGVPRWRCEPFCDSKRTDAALAKHPKILASCEKVATNPNIQKWLSMRGVNTF